MAQIMHMFISACLWELTWHLYLKKLPAMQEKIQSMEPFFERILNKLF